MIVTKEHQESMVEKYVKEKHTADECTGFIDGMAAMLSLVSNYASHPSPMSAEPTVQQLRDAAKNNPDTFLAGALYVIDNYKLNSHPMSAEQVEELYKQWCKETKRNGSVLVGSSIFEFFQWLKYTTPSVKADVCQHDCVAKDMYWKQCHKCGMILPIN